MYIYYVISLNNAEMTEVNFMMASLTYRRYFDFQMEWSSSNLGQEKQQCQKTKNLKVCEQNPKN